VLAAVGKRRQVKPPRTNIVCAKFGHPVPLGQVVNPAVQKAIGDRAVRALREVASEAISGLVFYFDTGVLYPFPSLGITERENDPSEPVSVTIAVRNPIATTPVPDTL
jgi:hypothetical protein